MSEGCPNVDIEFFHRLITDNLHVENSFSVGDTTVYVIDGGRPVHKRTIYVRDTPDGVVGYNFATAIAINYKVMVQLDEWFLENRNWKDGGYIEV